MQRYSCIFIPWIKSNSSVPSERFNFFTGKPVLDHLLILNWSISSYSRFVMSVCLVTHGSRHRVSSYHVNSFIFFLYDSESPVTIPTTLYFIYSNLTSSSLVLCLQPEIGFLSTFYNFQKFDTSPHYSYCQTFFRKTVSYVFNNLRSFLPLLLIIE